MFPGPDSDAFARVAARREAGALRAPIATPTGSCALGFIDVVIEATSTPTISADAAIRRGAGGIATDWQGAPLGLSSDGRVLIAGDKRTHSDALALLQG